MTVYEECEKYRGSLLNFARGRCFGDNEAAEDAVQEALLRAFKSQHLYSPEFGRVSTWVFRILRNHLIDQFRRSKTVLFDKAEEVLVNAISDQQDAISDLTVKEILSHIKRLPVKYQHIMEMAIERASYEDMAEEMGIPLGTLKAQLFRAREMMMGMINVSNQVKVPKYRIPEGITAKCTLVSSKQIVKIIKDENLLKQTTFYLQIMLYRAMILFELSENPSGLTCAQINKNLQGRHIEIGLTKAIATNLSGSVSSLLKSLLSAGEIEICEQNTAVRKDKVYKIKKK